jgi:NAD-dependent dihydropyrimidine dehydrogenase PreA subunit
VNGNEPECESEAGVFQPVIDRNRCEGKGICVAVCPYQVFDMGALAAQHRRGLTLRGKLKGYVHRWRQSFATGAEDCRACGKCVAACPEAAITLVRLGKSGDG